MPAAARLGDIIPHLGVCSIENGNHTVIIGGKPAARVTDMASNCILHGEKPIINSGSTSVMIGGLPAARIGDMAACCIPTAIVTGCYSVMIGG